MSVLVDTFEEPKRSLKRYLSELNEILQTADQSKKRIKVKLSYSLSYIQIFI